MPNQACCSAFYHSGFVVPYSARPRSAVPCSTATPKWRVEPTVKEVLFFPFSEEIVYSFFNFLFDILEQYKFGQCITAWKRGFGFWLYFYLFIFLLQSHSLPDISLSLLTLNYHSGEPPTQPPFCKGGGVELPTKFSKRGCLTGPQLLKKEFLGKRGVTFFRRGCNFHIKIN